MSLQLIKSNFAVEQDGYENEEIQVQRGGFWERLFDPDPTLPLWQMTKPKIIRKPKYKPVMYRIGNQLIAHPSLVEQLTTAMMNETGRSNTFSW